MHQRPLETCRRSGLRQRRQPTRPAVRRARERWNLPLLDRLVRDVTWRRLSRASGRVMLGCHGVSATAGEFPGRRGKRRHRPGMSAIRRDGPKLVALSSPTHEGRCSSGVRGIAVVSSGSSSWRDARDLKRERCFHRQAYTPLLDHYSRCKVHEIAGHTLTPASSMIGFAQRLYERAIQRTTCVAPSLNVGTGMTTLLQGDVV